MTASLSNQIFEALTDPKRSTIALVLGHYLNLLVILSMVLFCLELHPTLPVQGDPQRIKLVWFGMESFIAANFTLDLLAKLATAPSPHAYLLTGNILIDICSIIPWIYQFLWNAPTSLARQLRQQVEWAPLGLLMTLRLLRFFRFLTDTIDDADIFTHALRRSRIAFNFIFVYVFSASLFFGTAIYYAETRPCKFDPDQMLWKDSSGGGVCQIQSLLDGVWFATVTMFTVGYGDITPKTGAGKVVAGLLMICSCIVFGLCLAVYGSNLTELYLERRDARRRRKEEGSIVAPAEENVTIQMTAVKKEEVEDIPRYYTAGQYQSPHILINGNF